MKKALNENAKHRFTEFKIPLKLKPRLLFGVLTFVSLAACGGSDSSNNNEQTNISSDWGSLRWDQDSWN